MRIGFIASLFFFILSPELGAAEDTISVKAEIDKAFVTIGERIEYRVTATHDPSTQILSEITPPSSPGFELKEAHDFSEKQGKQIAEGRRFVLVSYELGEFILEPLTLKYRTSKGEEKTLQTHRLYVTVQSVDAGKPKTDIRGPKGVLGLPRRWGWLGSLLALIFALGGGAYAWWRWKNRALLGPAAREPLLSPEDEALLRLNQLFDSDLIRRGKLKEYFLTLSEILRFYFERRFNILAIESTTSEILRDLREKGVPESLREKIESVLEEADLVKFAKWKPSAAEIVRVNQRAKEVVEEARPKPEATEEAPSPTSHGV